jgi:hypothetical protein
MQQRTEKDIWIELSICEISTQCLFAGLAFKNIYPKALLGNDAAFTSIHSFLSHCAMVSKMLLANDQASVHERKTIGDILEISNASPIHDRTLRNHLEHYGERLKNWIKQYGLAVVIGTYNIGPKSAFDVPNMLFVRHYDPFNYTFTFVNDDFNLKQLFEEVERIKKIADNWIAALRSNRLLRPYN